MQSIEHMSETLAGLPVDRRVVYLMRHSVRFPIKSAADVYTAGLTEEGVGLACQFGAALSGVRQVRRVYASPISRCVDTAVAIAAGAGCSALVRADNRLAHPSIAPAWEALPGDYPDGSVPDELQSLLNFLFDEADIPGSVDLYVTHDTVVGALAGFFFCEKYTSINWPDYLEGAWLWQEDDQVHLSWRGKHQIITKETPF